MKINNLLKISSHQLDIVNDYSLDFIEFGHVENPPMIMVHGYADDYYVYNELIKYYESKYHIYAIQLPTVRNERVIDKKQLVPLVYAYHVAKFIEDKKLKNVILIGHSMGGGIATFVNNLVPANTIEKTIILDPMNCSNGVNLATIFKLNPKNLEQLIKILPYLYYNPTNVFGIKYEEHEMLLDAANRYGATNKNNNILFKNMASLKNKLDLSKATKHNPVLTLVIFGENDRLLFYKNAKKVFEKGSNFVFRTIKECGHVPQIEKPAETIALINEWLAIK